MQLSIAQIAEHVGLSRERVYQLLGEDASFPEPTGKIAHAAVWDEAEVRRWARRNGRTWSA